MELYRYISLKEFLEIIVCKKLTLKNPEKWPDKYEGYFYRALQSPDWKKAFWDSLKGKSFTDKDKERIENLVSATNNWLYCICFCKAKDSMVMWSAYSFNQEAIMIEMSREVLWEVCGDLAFTDIEYDTENTSVTSFADLVHAWDGTVSLFGIDELIKHKRSCFSYEKEVRGYLQDIEDEYERKNDKEIFIPITNLTELITGVLVHPGAKDEYVNLVKELCEIYSIPFNGKSKVYEFEKAFIG